ncbi:MAG: acylneuraminate cytidylyltransferase family protein [Actinomycetota bacterium]|nr:acylneuraminate cytidylyltransferase family protein [Actinomycetota bacterium]
MSTDPAPFCVIPARAGSSRIPDKNLALVGGQTLLERAIHTGLAAFGTVFVSTDDERYAALARAAGARVPALRSRELATDDSPVELALQAAYSAWADPLTEVVVVLQATSPFTTTAECLAAVTALRAHPAAGCAATVVRAPPTSAFLLTSNPDGLATFLRPDYAARRSQDLPPAWLLTGGVFAIRPVDLLAGHPVAKEPIVPVEVPAERGVDIDGPDDLARARAWWSG